MCFYIGIEDLAANALIESMRRAKVQMLYLEIIRIFSKRKTLMEKWVLN